MRSADSPLPRSVSVRPELPGDAEAVHAVLAAAFGREDEALIVDALRANGHLTVSLVAVLGDEQGDIVGHIAFSPVQIESARGGWHAIALGPLAVAPAYQRRGIGSQLVRAGLRTCRAGGHAVVIVLGHAQYYPRFGFVPASRYGVRYEQLVPDEVFMLLEVRPGAVAGRAGVVHHGREFYGNVGDVSSDRRRGGHQASNGKCRRWAEPGGAPVAGIDPA